MKYSKKIVQITKITSKVEGGEKMIVRIVQDGLTLNTDCM